MSETVKLYDLRERNYPDKRGDVFRSLQVFECRVCGALTNRVVMGGYARTDNAPFPRSGDLGRSFFLWRSQQSNATG